MFEFFFRTHGRFRIFTPLPLSWLLFRCVCVCVLLCSRVLMSLKIGSFDMHVSGIGVVRFRTYIIIFAYPIPHTPAQYKLFLVSISFFSEFFFSFCVINLNLVITKLKYSVEFKHITQCGSRSTWSFIVPMHIYGNFIEIMANLPKVWENDTKQSDFVMNSMS